MKICLVFPRFKYQFEDSPLGIAYVASSLQDRGIDVSILDATFDTTFDDIENYLKKNKLDIVGIYSDTSMFNDAVKVAGIVKKLGIFSIAGGPHPTIMPETMIPYVDIVVIGEGEETIIDIINNLKNLKKVKGIWYKKDGKIIKNPLREPIKNLDKLNFPARELLDMESYIKNWHYLDSVDLGLRGASIVASRGCPFQCTYCQPTLRSIFGPKLKKRSPKNVIEEIKQLKKNYNLDAIFFHDDTLTADKKWVKEFCKLLKKEKLNLVWACNTRVDTIDEDLMKEMYSTGLRGMHIGVESGSQRILNEIYRKGINLDKVKKVVEMARRTGIHSLCFFMIGAPSETEKEINKTMKFACSLKCDEVTFSITSPLPCTYLYYMVKKKGYKLSDNFSDFNYYSKRAFQDPNLPYKKLRYYQKKAFLLFYLHPYRWGYILKHIISIKGWKKMLIKIRRVM